MSAMDCIERAAVLGARLERDARDRLACKIAEFAGRYSEDDVMTALKTMGRQ